MRMIDELRQDGVKFQSLTEQFDSETVHGRFVLQMHEAMAEYFLDLNRERTIPVANIAKRMGLSRTTFYDYFPLARRQASKITEASRSVRSAADLIPSTGSS